MHVHHHRRATARSARSACRQSSRHGCIHSTSHIYDAPSLTLSTRHREASGTQGANHHGPPTHVVAAFNVCESRADTFPIIRTDLRPPHSTVAAIGSSHPPPVHHDQLRKSSSHLSQTAWISRPAPTDHPTDSRARVCFPYFQLPCSACLVQIYAATHNSKDRRCQPCIDARRPSVLPRLNRKRKSRTIAKPNRLASSAPQIDLGVVASPSSAAAAAAPAAQGAAPESPSPPSSSESSSPLVDDDFDMPAGSLSLDSDDDSAAAPAAAATAPAAADVSVALHGHGLRLRFRRGCSRPGFRRR